MVQVGLREANIHFSKYLRMVREGREVIVTDRGIPVSIIKPLIKEEQPEDKIKLLEEHGVLQKAVKRKIPLRKPIIISGKQISETVIERKRRQFLSGELNKSNQFILNFFNY